MRKLNFTLRTLSVPLRFHESIGIKGSAEYRRVDAPAGAISEGATGTGASDYQDWDLVGPRLSGATKFGRCAGAGPSSPTTQSTNVAAGLCDRARGGEILVAPDTARRTQGAFAYRRLGPVKFKNMSEEFEVFALKRV